MKPIFAILALSGLFIAGCSGDKSVPPPDNTPELGTEGTLGSGSTTNPDAAPEQSEPGQDAAVEGEPASDGPRLP